MEEHIEMPSKFNLFMNIRVKSLMEEDINKSSKFNLFIEHQGLMEEHIETPLPIKSNKPRFLLFMFVELFKRDSIPSIFGSFE